MLFRISLRNFLLHAVDYFTYTEILSMQYVIVSAGIAYKSQKKGIGLGGRVLNAVKANLLFPSIEISSAYIETGDKEALERYYMQMLEDKDDITYNDPVTNEHFSEQDMCIYSYIIEPILRNRNIVLLCREGEEEDYLTILCKYIKKKFDLDCVDLNQLFTKGKVGSIYIDRDDIKDHAVDLRKAYLRNREDAQTSTREGIAKTITSMKNKEKILKLKEFGIKEAKEIPKEKLDAILMEEWCQAKGID